jgi:uncharacterized protein YdhG (YjbR/CyaY superfamily)
MNAARREPHQPPRVQIRRPGNLTRDGLADDPTMPADADDDAEGYPSPRTPSIVDREHRPRRRWGPRAPLRSPTRGGSMFDEYLADLAGPARTALLDLIEHVASVAPEAIEGRSYGLPAFRYRSKPLLGFAAHRQHLGVYPFSPSALASVEHRLAEHSLTKGSIRFSPERPIPPDVLTDLVAARMAEIDGTTRAGLR